MFSHLPWRIRARDHGASITEYAALIVLVGVIGAVIAAGPIGRVITDNISRSICTAMGGEDCDPTEQQPTADDETPSPAEEDPADSPQSSVPEDHQPTDEDTDTYPDTVVPRADTPANPGGIGPDPQVCDPRSILQLCTAEDIADEDPFDLEPTIHPEDENASRSEERYDSEELPPFRSQRDGGEHNRNVRSAARTLAMGGGLIGWDEASEYLHHFLDGSGEDLTVDMDQFWDDIPEFRDEVVEQQEDIGDSAIGEAQDMDVDEPVTFPINTDWEPFGYRSQDDYGGGEGAYVYDDSNWTYAIGSLNYNLSGEVTVHPPETEGGDWTYEVDTDVNMQKYYDWDESATDPFFDGWRQAVFPYSEADLAGLHDVGLAQEYWLEGSTRQSHEGSG